MVITAKILHIGDERSGVSEHGAWCFTPVNVEWEQQDNPATSPYRQSAVVDIRGKLNREALEADIKAGKMITVWMDIRFRENQGRYYNGIRGNIGQEYKIQDYVDNSITDNNCDGV